LDLGVAPQTFASNLSLPNDLDYSLRGVTSGLVPKRLGLMSKTATCGILARSWPEWLTIDTILNISINWICLQDQLFTKPLAKLFPQVTFLEYSATLNLPSVDYMFCSHIMSGKNQALWSDSFLKAVFVNILKPRYVATGGWMCIPLDLSHPEQGGSTDCTCRLRVFTTTVLTWKGAIFNKTCAQSVSSLALHHHFGAKVGKQASRQNKKPEIWCISPGVYHEDGLFPLNKGRSPLLLLRCYHAESKWCKRRLKLYEQLQLYDISDSVIKPLYEETCVALVNVKGLTPLKMLYGGVETFFPVLPGGEEVLIKRRVKLLKGDVPPILSSGVSAKEQNDLRLGRDTGSSAVVNEATTHYDAEVPIYLWNDRLTRPWRILERPNDKVDVERDKTLYKAADAILNKFALPWWKRNVLRSFRIWFKITYRMPVGLNLPKLAIWGKYWIPFHGSYQWKYGWTAAQKRRYFHYWESQNGQPGIGKRQDSSAALECIT
jgi:hypothetical protein